MIGNLPGGDFLGGNFPGGKSTRGSLIGGNFPDTISQVASREFLFAATCSEK